MKDYEVALKAPFSVSDLEWRVGSTFSNGTKGILLPFVSARAIMNRLDTIFGVAGWKDSYAVYPDLGVACTLTATTEDGKIIEKCNAAEFTQVSGLKGGFSGALKRAASEFGIGRYLYDLPTVNVDLDNKRFKGRIEALPDEFVPESERTGCTEVKIKYKNSRKSGGNNKPSSTDVPSMTLDEAMAFVVRGDKYNEGKKMSEVWEKSLRFLANGRDKEQAQAARIVAQHKGFIV